MRTISFHKKGQKPLCQYCKKTPVEPERWDKKCDNCKKENAEEDPDASIIIGQRQPAAIWEDESGDQVFVDKFGIETENPGYDTKNDPRGWKHTGTKSPEREII